MTVRTAQNDKDLAAGARRVVVAQDRDEHVNALAAVLGKAAAMLSLDLGSASTVKLLIATANKIEQAMPIEAQRD